MEKLSFEQHDSIDVGLEATIYGRERLTLCLTDDWCGDTETGFGASVSFTMDREQAAKLYAFISHFFG